MSCPSRRDVLHACSLAIVASIAGCFGDQAPSEAASPTPTGPATPSARQAGTEPEQTDAETRTAESPTASEGGETSRETTERPPQETDEPPGTETNTPDCTVYDISVKNTMSRTISASLRITEGGGNGNNNEEDDSIPPTPTPTPTPNEVFSDSFRLGSDEWQQYDDIPDREGYHRLEVDVEDGPSETKVVDADDWEGTKEILVFIESDDIRFTKGEQSRPPGC